MSAAIRVISTWLCLAVTVSTAACKAAETGSHTKVEPAPGVRYEDPQTRQPEEIRNQAKEELEKRRFAAANRLFLRLAYEELSSFVGQHLDPESNPDAAGKVRFLWKHIQESVKGEGGEVAARFACALQVVGSETKTTIFMTRAKFTVSYWSRDRVVLMFQDVNLYLGNQEPGGWVPEAKNTRSEWAPAQPERYPLGMITANTYDGQTLGWLDFTSADAATLSLRGVVAAKPGSNQVRLYCTEASNLAKIGDSRLTPEVFEAGGLTPANAIARQR